MTPLDARDQGLLVDILVYGERACRHIHRCSQQRFVEDEMIFDSVVRCLSVIGEAAWKVSKGVQECYPEVPWLTIAGMRHRLVHDYAEVEPTIAYRVVTEHLPVLIEQVRRIVVEHGIDY